ncbi:type VI secretion protein [Streptomyces heilongjiangensis]|uniref:Type VI secretion protein n=1 Tax=Streptomyces heilongjiangensis TaxID=945052 RepID=A0ABW1BKV1_9ACTN|nr:type VI secretion protein [Streptomyces heilongjiangensis]MDC2952567.1 type VI secretion protein [Streptomyces heilongjiangensis]
MRPDDRHRHPQQGGGGVPDGLLITVLGFLVGVTLLVWSATGLAGLFAHGAWPDRVSFTRTPLAVRSLVSAPQDLPAAWPDTPAAQLSGYGLFWGLLIGQLMILIVLTVFITGTLARWRAVRAREKAARAQAAAEPAPLPHRTRIPSPPLPEPRNGTTPPTGPDHIPAPLTGTATERETVTAGTTDSAYETIPTPGAAPTVPTTTATPAAPATMPQPAPSVRTAAGVPAALFPPEGKQAVARPAPTLLLGGAETRRPAATQAVRDADGPVLVVTSDPVLWSDTKDARAKLGPVLLYDPAHRCDTPARLHWSPVSGCEDKPTAVARAGALLAPIRPAAKIDQAVADTAETLLRSYLHAAAIDSRTVRHLHRWAQGTNVQEAVRILRTNAKAAAGSAGELESALTSHPERRDMAQALTARALSALSTVNVRESCTPNRADSLVLDSFVHEGGTLYVVGDPIEDPKANPSAMPLLTALASSVVERGRRVAERSSSGRLDPPLTLVLDDVAAVAPLPQLPDLLATGTDRGLPTLALLRSREQARARWPHAELPV